MFQLTKEEYNSLKCQIGTSNKRGGDRRALPYAFTQQGIGMLSGKNHDRFLMIDDDVYLLGASVKDIGVGMCAVTKMEVSPETILALLKK